MPDIKTYKDLIVWQKSIQLVKLIYSLTASFPEDERFGITNQLRRAVVSIPSNIAEGFGRKTQNDRLHFYIIAFGSALEIETQVFISKELKFGDTERYKEVDLMLTEVLKMLNKMTSSVRFRS
jgi:four helix bundle protein